MSNVMIIIVFHLGCFFGVSMEKSEKVNQIIKKKREEGDSWCVVAGEKDQDEEWDW